MCDMMMEVIYGPMMEVHFLSGTFSVIDLPDDLLEMAVICFRCRSHGCGFNSSVDCEDKFSVM